jgi:hypothetical protein
MKNKGRHIRAAAVLSFAALAGVAHADWFLANSNADNIYASQTGCAQFTGFLPTGDRPQGVAVSPDGSRIYVANYEGSVTVIDARSHATLGTVRVSQNTLSVAATATRIYSVGGGRLDITDAGSLTNVGTVLLPGYAMKVVASRDGSRVFVSSSGYLTILDTATNIPSFVALDPNVMGPRGLDVSPNGQRVYIAHGGNIDVVDTATNSVVNSIPIPDGGEPMDVAVNVDGTRIFVAVNKNVNGTALPGQMMVFDTASNALLATRATGRSPAFIAANRSLIFVSTLGETGYSGGVVSTFWTDGYALAEHVQAFSIPAGVAAWDPPPSTPPEDLEITGIEVTQGINDLAGSVRLVAGRRTFVRVHVRSTLTDVPGINHNVSGNLFGATEYCTQGQNCIDVIKGSIPNINQPALLQIPPNPNRGNIHHSLLFELPWAWVSSGEPLKLYPAVAGHGMLPASSCAADLPMKRVYFELGTELNVQFVRMRYPFRTASGGSTYIEATKAHQDESEAMLKRFFPLSEIRARDPVVMNSELLKFWVERTAFGCIYKLPPERRDECATLFVNHELGALRTAWGNIGPGAYGDADGVYGLIPPVPNGVDPDGSLFGVRGQCCVNRASSGFAHHPMTTTHEIAHMLGRDHPAEHAAVCGHADRLDPNYPHPLTLIHPLAGFNPATGLMGFDPGHARAPGEPETDRWMKDEAALVGPRVLTPYNTFDLLSYCQPRGISDYTYNALYLQLRAWRPDFSPTKRTVLKLPPRKGVPVPGDWLMVTGEIRADGGFALARRLAGVVNPPTRVAGAYAIRLLDGAGAVLADYPFTPTAGGDAVGVLGGVFEVVPFAVGTRTVRLVEIANARVVANEAVSASAPTVSSVVLAGPPSGFGGEVSLSWSGSDADGDALSYDVLISRDGGVNFTPLIVGSTATTATVETARIGGGSVRLRVVAKDGVHTGFADSAAFSIPDKTPEVRIVLPGVEDVYVGQAVNFEASVSDPQDGSLPAASIVWRLGARTLATGRRITVGDFPAGLNEVSVTATNSLGLSATAYLELRAVPRTPPAAPVIAASPRYAAWQVAAGATQTQTTDLAVLNAGTGALNFTVTPSESWVSVSASAGVAPQTLTISANPSGLANGTLRRAYLTIAAAGLGEIDIPVQLAVGNTHDRDESSGALPPPPPVPMPVAAAGNDITVNEGTAVTLAGTASTVAAGHAANYQWTQLTGTTVTLANATSMSATFTAPRPSGTSEVLSFRLTVTDDTSQSATDEVSITVNALPAPPVNPPANPPPPPAKKGGGSLEWLSLAVLLVLTLWRVRTSSRDSRRKYAVAAR